MAEQIQSWKSTDGTLHETEHGALRADFRHIILTIAGEFDPKEDYIFDDLIEKMWRSRGDLHRFFNQFLGF